MSMPTPSWRDFGMEGKEGEPSEEEPQWGRHHQKQRITLWTSLSAKTNLIIWFVVWVTRALCRIAYICRRAAAPFACAFVGWLLAMLGAQWALVRRREFARQVGVIVTFALLVAGAPSPGHASEPQSPIPTQVRRLLEMEDWPAVLNGLAGDPLTNSILRLVVVRALFETGRLPDEQFSWLHSPGPELLSTSELMQYAGAGHIGDTLVQLGHLNAGERLAFDSLELEGETPSVLRTLVRLHVVKGLTNAAGIFLNRLQAYPEHSAWAVRFRAALATNLPAAADPTISRIRTNLITRDRIATGLTTERLLRQALESNPENRMAFQFLVAHQLLARELLRVRQTLAASTQTSARPLPRHYAEAVVLHRSLYPGISLGALLSRVPPTVVMDFQRFHEMMNRAAGSREQAQPEAWRDFGNTYWYYYFFGAPGPPSHLTSPSDPQPHE